MKIVIGISIGIFPDDKDVELYIYNDGTKFSSKNNKTHNIDGPREYADGDETWLFEGNFNRVAQKLPTYYRSF